MLIARAEVRQDCSRDIRIAGGTIVEIGDALRPKPDEDVLDARGAAVLPGLHDHHVHLRAAAAAARSLDVGGVMGAEALRGALHTAADALAPGAWLRVVGYHESIAGELDRATLDALAPAGRPVRVQHRTGALWVLNTAAMADAGLEASNEPGVDAGTGRLWRRDDLVRTISTLDPADLRRLGEVAASRGITGFTDATPGGEPTQARELARELRAAGVTQHLHLMGPVGAVAPDVERAALGPVKVLLDDDALPPLDELTATIRAAHGEGRVVATHCVTRVQLVMAITALADAGTSAQGGDRIEHGSVIPADMVDELARLGVTVVTQPHFVAERGDDYRRDVDPDDVESLYRVRSLVDAGVAVAAGTDAPFGSPDPWSSMAAAVERRTRLGEVLGADERVEPATALDLYLGHADAPGVPRAIGVGEPADLCVLAVPWRALGSALDEGAVRCTLMAGDPVFASA